MINQQLHAHSPHPDGSDGTLWQLINVWLGTKAASGVFISKLRSGEYRLCVARGKFDDAFGIIGDTWVTVPPGEHIEAADPEFFNKLDKAIEHVRSRSFNRI